MEEKKTKKALKALRAAGVSFLALTIICGLLYTLSVTIFAQAIFPYESNGSVITVTTKDGIKRTVGSELIGQSYIKMDSNQKPVLVDDNSKQYITSSDEKYYLDLNNNFILEETETTPLALDTKTTVMYQAKYLIGRNNSGAPSNASPEADAYRETIEERKLALEKIGYNSSYNEAQGVKGIPSDMVTESGSGVDPEISYDTAIYQVSMIAKSRNMEEASVKEIIDKYTKGKFLGIFGHKRVNVLMVNLALDGLI